MSIALGCFQRASSRCLICLLVFALTTALFYGLGMQLNQLGLLANINTLFDYDTAWYVDAIGRAPEDWQWLTPSSRASIWVKHPYIYGLYWLAYPLLMLGLSPVSVSVLLIASSMALAVSCLYLIALVMGAGVLNAILVCALFAASSTLLAIGGLPEAYGLVQFPMAALWLVVALVVYRQLITPPWLRALFGALASGYTLFFLAFYVLVEGMLWLQRRGYSRPLAGMVDKQLLLAAFWYLIFMLLGFLVSYFPYLAEVLNDPMGAAHRLVWAVHQNGEKSGVVPLLQAFFVYPLVSPNITKIWLPGEGWMIDYRSFEIPPLALIAWGLFAAFVIQGLNRMLAKAREGRWLAVGILIWLLFICLFHMQYQYRGSLFLYAPHHWVAVFIPLIAFIVWLSHYSALFNKLTPILLTAILIVVASNNILALTQVWDFAATLDT